ncbi:hypothetical protein G6F22_015450 [Rhizopus arrhizus]|nr:hypothetical protein G6F22_015450 [Rhizopus arrhizus]
MKSTPGTLSSGVRNVPSRVWPSTDSAMGSLCAAIGFLQDAARLADVADGGILSVKDQMLRDRSGRVRAVAFTGGSAYRRHGRRQRERLHGGQFGQAGAARAPRLLQYAAPRFASRVAAERHVVVAARREQLGIRGRYRSVIAAGHVHGLAFAGFQVQCPQRVEAAPGQPQFRAPVYRHARIVRRQRLGADVGDLHLAHARPSDAVGSDVFQVFLQHQPEPAHGRGGLVGQRHAQFGGVAHDDLAASGGGVRGLDAQPPVLEQPQAGGLGIRQGKGGVSRQNHVPQGVGQARHPGFRGLGGGAGQPMGPPPG